MVPRRLVPKNGVEYLIRALPRLRERLPEVEVVLVGDGPERGALEELARHLKVDDLTRFMGGRPHEEMPGLLSSADLVVVPSLMEATSVAALEAMACAVPVAASRVGGLPEIVNGETGTLFSPGDPEDLADRVGDLALQPDLRELGHRARERVVERWSNDRLVERHLTIYRALVEGRQPPSPGGDVPGYGEPEQGE